MIQQTKTQHEVDRERLRHERRHFDKMNDIQVIGALMWRRRVPLLLMSNIATLVVVIKLVF